MKKMITALALVGMLNLNAGYAKDEFCPDFKSVWSFAELKKVKFLPFNDGRVGVGKAECFYGDDQVVGKTVTNVKIKTEIGGRAKGLWDNNGRHEDIATCNIPDDEEIRSRDKPLLCPLVSA